MKVCSLFAGIGGFDLALTRLGHEIVYINEWNKYAAQTYEKNFNQKPDTRDISEVPTSGIPDHDILVGGFPCQSFSIAGKRRGFDETRGTLFFEIARILRDKRPGYFLLENVKGLLSHDGGKTFQTILRVLTELGYEYQWQVINSKNFGVPQNRERIYIIGNLRASCRPEIFPFRESNPKNLKELTTNTTQGYRVYRPDGISTTIASQAGGVGAKTGLYDMSFIDMQLTGAKSTEISRTIQARYYKGYSNRYGESSGILAVPLKFLQRNQKNYQGKYSFTVDTANTGGVLQHCKIRRLTPIECERLQGFPDNWTEGVSDTQRYKQLGNAVTVNVVSAIAKRIWLD